MVQEFNDWTFGAIFEFSKTEIRNKPLTVVGDERLKTRILYVTDVAKSFPLAAKSKKNEIYNLGANKHGK